MASWLDVVALVVTAAAFGGTIYGVVYVMRQITQGLESTKESLKNQGVLISDKGVAVKTSKRFDRDDYVDATQRGFIKAMSAASFVKGEPNSSPSSPDSTPSSSISPILNRENSTSSIQTTSSAEERKKKGFFGLRKGTKDKL